jgi:hypothetical protein
MSMSVEFQLDLCTECNIEHEVFDLKVEENTNVTIKVEEMAEAISDSLDILPGLVAGVFFFGFLVRRQR